jgi:hypothetical protein
MYDYIERDEDERYLAEIEVRLAGQKHRSDFSDHDDSSMCAIVDCDKVADKSAYITLKGCCVHKRYCPEHFRDQVMGERMYELGL